MRDRQLLLAKQSYVGKRVTVMADVVDSVRNIAVALSAYPSMEITSVTAPSSARPGEAIVISCIVRNNGGDGRMWITAYDIDTGEVYLPREEAPIYTGDSGSITVVSIAMPNRDLNVRIEVGHVED